LSQPEQRELLKGRIKRLLKRTGRCPGSHYYVHPDLQDLAEETGGCVADSPRNGTLWHNHPAKTVVVCGVRFMGETAKIPETRKSASFMPIWTPTVHSTWLPGR